MSYQNNLEESNEKRIENEIFTAVQEVFSNTNSSIELLENEPDQNTFYHELYFQQPKTKETKETKEIKEIEETKEAKEPKEIKETKETKESSSNQENKIKKNIFKITKEKFNIPKYIQKKRRRGRRPRNDSHPNEQCQKPPRKFYRDNILSKNQVHFFSYIILFINCLLNFYGIKKQFKQIDYNLKRNVNFDNFMDLRTKTLGDILCKDITKKFKKKENNYNYMLYQEIKGKKNPIINNFFEKNYLLFFQNFYYVNCKSINIKDFGNKDDVYINLSGKVITFQDKIDSFGDKIYAETYKSNVEELYFPKIWEIKN